MSRFLLYVGTYTDGDSDGIYACRMDESTGKLLDATLAAEAEDPSFLALSHDHETLYAVNECEEGAVTAFRIGDDGALTERDRRVIGPADPCHCSLSPGSEHLFVAHYTGGAVSVLPIADGELGDPTVIEHEGSSVHPERQTAPHPHSVTVGPQGEYLYVPDLGADEIVVYDIDPDSGELRRHDVVQVREGAGPRSLRFHDGAAFLVNELDSTLSRFVRDSSTGTLEHIDTVETIEGSHDGENYPAHVSVHPNSNRVYASNRGHDSVAIVDCADDGLQVLGTESTNGEWPRHFTLSPGAEYLLSANSQSDTIVPLEIDSDGRLTVMDEVIDVPQAVCIVVVG